MLCISAAYAVMWCLSVCRTHHHTFFRIYGSHHSSCSVLNIFVKIHGVTHHEGVEYILISRFSNNITVWTVVQTVLTATFNSYGNRQISTSPHNTPERIDKKIGTADYDRDKTPSYTKFGTNPSTGGFWANGWNITKIISIYLFMSERRQKEDTRHGHSYNGTTIENRYSLDPFA